MKEIWLTKFILRHQKYFLQKRRIQEINVYPMKKQKMCLRYEWSHFLLLNFSSTQCDKFSTIVSFIAASRSQSQWMMPLIGPTLLRSCTCSPYLPSMPMVINLWAERNEKNCYNKKKEKKKHLKKRPEKKIQWYFLAL